MLQQLRTNALSIEPMHQFELTTFCRLPYGPSGVVRSNTLVNSESPRCVSQTWEINEADFQLTNRYIRLRRRLCVKATTCPTAARSTAVVICVHTGDAVL